MSVQTRGFDAPIWIAPNQISAVANALKSGDIATVQQQLAGQRLIERPDLTQTFNGKSVTLWEPQGGSPVTAVAELSANEITVATKTSILLPFKGCCNGCSDGVNAALLTTDQQKFQFFGKDPRSKIPQDPSFRAAASDIVHYAIHMIGKPHDCSGIEAGPGGMR